MDKATVNGLVGNPTSDAGSIPADDAGAVSSEEGGSDQAGISDRLAKFEKFLTAYNENERERIMTAARWGESLHRDQKRASGEPYFVHPIGVAEILVALKLDADTVTASLLHDVLEDTEAEGEQIRKLFGPDVEAMVEGVTKIDLLRAKNKTVQEAETIRKMFFAMVKDIRVILIKLADKLNNMRTLRFLKEERQKAIATECLDIYAPLADRLGISWMKDELEDLALKSINYEAYEQIKSIVAAKKGERSEYLKRVKNAIYKSAAKNGLQISVDARAKHFYSIYQKMRKRNKNADEIYDLLGLRILCENVNDCYTLLGIVHQLWKPIEGRFKDYIAMPKANAYQSLHTTVMCYEGKLLEIQIRTYEMHQVAEFGVASHWLYKKGEPKEKSRHEALAFINRLKEWDGGNLASGDFLDEIKRDLLKDSIYVFTPKGDSVELPAGSNAVDFAFHIHTDIGTHCIGAKADNQIIPLTEELKNTQVIEIITSPNAHPHLNWLRSVRTAKARSKIRAWLLKNDESLIFGKNVVAKKRPAPPQPEKPAPQPVQTVSQPTEDGKQILPDGTRVGVRAGEERNMMIRFAGCCKPTTGDVIVGYVSRGRGIIVHKKNCRTAAKIPDFAERMIEVEWETVSPRISRRFRVTAGHSADIFSEIEGAVRKQRGHLLEGKVEDTGANKLSGYFTIELENKDDLKRVVKNIRAIPDVLNLELIQ
jgi:guanosine-3',5'-bis(diphosphate) 3'-pyrophosphohydrolase